jgi:hypothetical protein
MIEAKNIYFKVRFGGPELISGWPLPDPLKGPYHFVNCSFHPGLEDELQKNYKTSRFTDCER